MDNDTKKGWGYATLFLAVIASGVVIALEPYEPLPKQGTCFRFQIYVDEATGCEYLSAGGGLTPRMKPDGTQMCLSNKQPAQTNYPVRM